MKVTKDEKNKDKALEQVLADIEKQFGAGAIMKLGDNDHMNVDVTSSGSITIDVALGVGGYPKGRIIEIYGPESSGKTTVALQAIAEVQNNGGRAAFIDAEHALDPIYAKNLGVNVNELLLSQPDTGEQALEICDALVKSDAVDIVVIDSVAALVPQAEIDGEMGDSHVGLQARLMSQALRKLSGTMNKTKTTAIFINQLREKVGVMFGNPETTPGGRALKFYSSIRLDVRRGEQIKVGDQIVGNKTNIKVVKNKVAPPFKTATVDIMYGEGISREGEIIDIASDLAIIDKSGAWYSYNGEKIGQGKENVNVEIKKGEVVGFIGSNGAGKSTLLKVVAGVMKPTEGKVNAYGNICPMIELGAGFDPQLTARENIYLNGAVMGYSKQLIDEKFDEIVEFSELKDFLDVPVQNFSSGMVARLAFSIATIVDPEILIVDEILSVGDIAFQAKSERKMMDMIGGGTTVLFVSHSLSQIKKLCDKVVWIEHGVVQKIGGKEVCDEYLKFMEGKK